MKDDLMVRCQAHWLQLEIWNADDLKRIIRKIFVTHTRQDEILVDIYRLVLPDWDRIDKVHGYPEVGSAFWQFVCRKFIEFDLKNHPKVFAGGLWLNCGFQSNSELDPWELSFETCWIKYKT